MCTPCPLKLYIVKTLVYNIFRFFFFFLNLLIMSINLTYREIFHNLLNAELFLMFRFRAYNSTNALSLCSFKYCKFVDLTNMSTSKRAMQLNIFLFRHKYKHCVYSLKAHLFSILSVYFHEEIRKMSIKRNG